MVDACVKCVGLVSVCLSPLAFSSRRWLAPLSDSTAKRRADCVSLSLSVHSLCISKPCVVPPRGDTW